MCPPFHFREPLLGWAWVPAGQVRPAGARRDGVPEPAGPLPGPGRGADAAAGRVRVPDRLPGALVAGAGARARLRAGAGHGAQRAAGHRGRGGEGGGTIDSTYSSFK